MAYEPQKTVTLKLTLSPALYRQLEIVAQKARKPLDSTIKSLLWIGMGQFNLRTRGEPRDG